MLLMREVLLLRSSLPPEDALCRRSSVKILPWETRLEDKAILSHVSAPSLMVKYALHGYIRSWR